MFALPRLCEPKRMIKLRMRPFPIIRRDQATTQRAYGSKVFGRAFPVPPRSCLTQQPLPDPLLTVLNPPHNTFHIMPSIQKRLYMSIRPLNHARQVRPRQPTTIILIHAATSTGAP